VVRARGFVDEPMHRLRADAPAQSSKSSGVAWRKSMSVTVLDMMGAVSRRRPPSPRLRRDTFRRQR
jgi:hypothetical protein